MVFIPLIIPWDTVDHIASNHAGQYFLLYPEQLFIADRWMVAESNEFFIQKAIGWSLRQYSKFNPEAVINFVNSNTLSNLSKREAFKVLNRTSN